MVSQPKWHPPIATPTKKLHLLNSLTKQKDLFTAIGNNIGWYCCGPTVYDKSHLGHARTYITFDVHRRILMNYFGYNVLYVMNITDVDDKIIVGARKSYLLSEFLKKHSCINTELVKTCQEAWEDYVNTNLSKYLPNASKAWDEFTKKVKNGTIKPLDDDLKFSLYLKTAVGAKEAIDSVDTGSSQLYTDGELNSFEHFVEKTRDIISMHLDKTQGQNVKDPQIFRKFAAYWEDEFFKDTDALNILRPDILTRVSEYIPEIVEYVKQIMKNGYGYEADGSIYFDTLKFDQTEGHCYAKLEPWSATNVKLMSEGEGELSEKTFNKRNASDFALWKKSKPGEPAWDSPWGNGRPGWHIECSVMASAVLGENMDIHSGGIDLAFPHHDNELAQAEGFFNCKQWVNYFLHTGHLHIEGMKMSKSLKNFLSIREGLETITAAQMRLMFILHSWEATLDFSSGSITEAQNVEQSIENFLVTVKAVVNEQQNESQNSSGKHNYGHMESELLDTLAKKQEAVHDALCDSFNTPKAMSEIRSLVSTGNQYYLEKAKLKLVPNSHVLRKYGTYISKMMTIFGVFQDRNPLVGTFLIGSKSISKEEQLLPIVNALSTFRDAVRKLAQSKADPKAILELCDKLRDEDMVELGVSLEDREVKLVDKDVLLAQRQAIKDKEKQKQASKEERLRLEALKLQEELDKARTPPEDLFKTSEFSEWDDRGIPVKDKEGAEISKSRRKKLEKEWASQEKRHRKFLVEHFPDSTQ